MLAGNGKWRESKITGPRQVATGCGLLCMGPICSATAATVAAIVSETVTVSDSVSTAEKDCLAGLLDSGDSRDGDSHCRGGPRPIMKYSIVLPFQLHTST